jgi:hypothetical protein
LLSWVFGADFLVKMYLKIVLFPSEIMGYKLPNSSFLNSKELFGSNSIVQSPFSGQFTVLINTASFTVIVEVAFLADLHETNSKISNGRSVFICQM